MSCARLYTHNIAVMGAQIGSYREKRFSIHLGIGSGSYLENPTELPALTSFLVCSRRQLTCGVLHPRQLLCMSGFRKGKNVTRVTIPQFGEGEARIEIHESQIPYLTSLQTISPWLPSRQVLSGLVRWSANWTNMNRCIFQEFL